MRVTSLAVPYVHTRSKDYPYGRENACPFGGRAAKFTGKAKAGRNRDRNENYEVQNHYGHFAP